jgi:hypothetical protein
MQERAKLLEEIEKKTLPSTEITDNESQTDNRQHETIVQLNNKLKNELQSFKDKIERIVMKRPNLFDGISEEANERLDHLISTLENQGTQMDALQVEEQLRNEIKQLQRYVTRRCSSNLISCSISELCSSLETNQNTLDNERQMKMEQLSSIVEDYQKQIEQLQQNLSGKDNEQISLGERLNEVELELRKTVDDHASKLIKYEEDLQSLVQERNALIENQRHDSEEQ